MKHLTVLSLCIQHKAQLTFSLQQTFNCVRTVATLLQVLYVANMTHHTAQ